MEEQSDEPVNEKIGPEAESRVEHDVSGRVQFRILFGETSIVVPFDRVKGTRSTVVNSCFSSSLYPSLPARCD